MVEELCTAPSSPSTTGSMITTGLVGAVCKLVSRMQPLMTELRCHTSPSAVMSRQMNVSRCMMRAGAGFGYLAYKRPRLAAVAGGLVAFTTLPYVRMFLRHVTTIISPLLY